MVPRCGVVSIAITCFILGVHAGRPGPLDLFTLIWSVVAVCWLAVIAIGMILSWLHQIKTESGHA